MFEVAGPIGEGMSQSMCARLRSMDRSRARRTALSARRTANRRQGLPANSLGTGNFPRRMTRDHWNRPGLSAISLCGAPPRRHHGLEDGYEDRYDFPFRSPARIMSAIPLTGSPSVAARLAQRLRAAPGDGVARHNFAVELRKLDRNEEALDEAERAWREGFRTPETAALRGHLLADLGRFDEAERALQQAIRLNPQWVEPAQALAALMPQLGRQSEALDGFRDALARAPGTGILWVEAMAAAKAHGDWVQLLEWSDAAERRFGADTMISVFAARALSGMGRDEEARVKLTTALSAEPGYAPGQATLAHVLIRLGRYDDAERAALSATQLAPRDQSGWALLGTIWRQTEDPREDWLCRYDELIMLIEVALPAGLADNLNRRHRARAHPADQSLRGGTQTPGNLFQSADPLIIELAHELREAIEPRLAELPQDQAHPFLGRNSSRIAFSASWSVRLSDQGFHIGHMHPAGWISSALYVSLPPEVASGGDQGILTFGVPDAALGLELTPRWTVQPREGLLVLFPSYLWHGTTPFQSASPRLTVAFDALPVADRGAAA
jgi:tetratricopeptide (TPR) repeat protein